MMKVGVLYTSAGKLGGIPIRPYCFTRDALKALMIGILALVVMQPMALSSDLPTPQDEVQAPPSDESTDPPPAEEGIATITGPDESTIYSGTKEDWDEANTPFFTKRFRVYTLEKLGLYLGGRFTLDGMKYSHANERDSGLEIEEARVWIEGRHDDFSWRFEPDLVGDDTPGHVWEAWAGYEFDEGLRLRVGQMPVALSSEFATRQEYAPLVGYSFPSYLTGRYDLAARLEGDLFKGILWYETTATSGNGFDLEGERRGDDQYSARVVCHPFWRIDKAENSWMGTLRGFFVGAAFARQRSYDENLLLTTPFEDTVFRTRDLEGDQGSWWHLESGLAIGPFRGGGEWVRGYVDDVCRSVSRGPRRRSTSFTPGRPMPRTSSRARIRFGRRAAGRHPANTARIR